MVLLIKPREVNGETGEPRSSSLKSGLLLSSLQLNESRNRLVIESKAASCEGFLECDIILSDTRRELSGSLDFVLVINLLQLIYLAKKC